MIYSFRVKDTREVISGIQSRELQANAKDTRNKVEPLDNAAGLQDLRLPGLCLEKLVTVQVPRSPRAILLNKSCGIGYLMVDECTASRPAGERSGKGNRATSPGVGR